MEKFIETRLAPVRITKEKNEGEGCTPRECSQARAVLGSLNWLTRELRAHGTGKCSLPQQA
eukprot:4145606-Pyramimonas_sp.AAC.1